MHQRMSQRSIKQGWLDLVKIFGVDVGDRFVLNKNGIDGALEAMKKLSADLQKMRTRGGIVLVLDGETEITTFAVNSTSN